MRMVGCQIQLGRGRHAKGHVSRLEGWPAQFRSLSHGLMLAELGLAEINMRKIREHMERSHCNNQSTGPPVEKPDRNDEREKKNGMQVVRG